MRVSVNKNNGIIICDANNDILKFSSVITPSPDPAPPPPQVKSWFKGMPQCSVVCATQGHLKTALSEGESSVGQCGPPLDPRTLE